MIGYTRERVDSAADLELLQKAFDRMMQGARASDATRRACLTKGGGTRYIAAELVSFERKDVLTKSYPLGDHVIICEKDSWFNHPLLSDIPDLLKYFRYWVLQSDYPGKYLEASLNEGKFLAPLRDARKPQIKALLLGDGGNDLISWKKGSASFSPIFRKGRSTTSPTDYIDAANLKRALQDVTRSLVRISDKLAQANTNGLPVLLHCYDYIFPRFAETKTREGEQNQRHLWCGYSTAIARGC